MKGISLSCLLLVCLYCSAQTCDTSVSQGGDPPTNLAISCALPTICSVTWNTAHNASSWVVLGAYDGSGGDARQYSNMALGTSHLVTVDHLMPNTTYNYYAASCSGVGACPPTSSNWSSAPVTKTGGVVTNVAFCTFTTPGPSSGTFAFDIWEYGQSNIYQSSSADPSPYELWVNLQLPIIVGSFPTGGVYLTSATVDGQTCSYTDGGGSCGSTNLGVALMSGTDFNKGSLNYYSYHYSHSGPNPSHYVLDNLGNGAFLRVFPSGGSPAVGSHSVSYTLQGYTSSGPIGSAVTTKYNFNVVSPASFSANPPTSFPTIPGYPTYIQQMAYLGTGWCSKNPATNSTNGSIINEQAGGNFYNTGMSAADSAFEQWNYDGNRVYKQISDVVGAAYPGWTGGISYGTTATNMAVRPPLMVNPGGYTYIAYVGGTSGSTQPNWTAGSNQTPGTTFLDHTGGALTWINAGKTEYWNSCSLKVGDPMRNWYLATHLTSDSEWNQFPFGILMDYYRTGDKLNENGTVVTGLNAKALAYGATVFDATQLSNLQSKYYKTPDTIAARSRSYSANNFIANWLVTGTEDAPGTGPYLERSIDTILGHLDSIVNYNANQSTLNTLNASNGTSNVAWNLAIHPFTVGIELNTAIAYYNAQIEEGQTPDARIPVLVRATLDWLWNFWNLNGSNYAFAYQFWEIPKLATFNQSNFTELNDTVAPAYAWMWSICGSSCTLPDGVTTYQQAADATFQHEFDHLDHFYTAKQFNQAFEMSFDCVNWRNGSSHYSDMTILGPSNPNLGPYADTAVPYNATINTAGLVITETAAPICSGGVGTMTITWETFEHTNPALTQILYGVSQTTPSNTVTGTDTETQLTMTDNQWQHVATASGIPAGTYYYAVATTDDAGNRAQSSYSSTFPAPFSCTVH